MTPVKQEKKISIVLTESLSARMARYWVWELIAVTIVGIGAGVILLWAPEYARLNQASLSTIDAREQEVSAIRVNIRELEGIQKTFAELNPEHVSRVYSALPKEQTFTDLLLRLSVAAQRNGFTLDALSIQKAPTSVLEKGKKEAIEAVSVNARLAGVGYVQWKQFLQTIEHQLPILDLASTQFNNTAEFQEFLFRTYQLP